MASPEHENTTRRKGQASTEARKITRILTDLTTWVDDTFPEAIEYRRKRCLARVVLATSYEGSQKRRIELAIHGKHNTCDGPRFHALGAEPISFEVVHSALWRQDKMTGVIMPLAGVASHAHTVYKVEVWPEDEITGFGLDSEIGWNQPVNSPEALDAYCQTLRSLTTGEIAMREAAETLIGQPAAIPPSYFDFLDTL